MGGQGVAMSVVQELSGTTLKGYQLEACLGWSSHTAVYSAWRGGSSWAVKILDGDLAPDHALVDRIRREADVLADVGNPSILPIHDSGRTGSLTYAVSPLVRARTLHDLMRSGQLSSEQAWTILDHLAVALDCAHRRGLVCRQLKPGHVLVDEGRVYLAEFGIASDRVGRLAMAAPTYHVTAPQYLAPEQVEGRDPDYRADIYALAVLVFEILTGTELQGARSPLEAMRATLDGSPPSATERQPELPSGLDLVLGRALARDPQLRHRSAAELLEQLVTLPEEQGRVLAPAARLVSGAAQPVAVVPPVAPPAPLAPQKVPTPESSMVAVLRRMEVPVLRGSQDVILNSYFAELVRHARQACGADWPEVAVAAGLEAYVEADPRDDALRTAPVASVSRLMDAVDTVFDMGTVEVLRQWGRLTTDSWMRRMQERRDGDLTYVRPIRLWTSSGKKVEDVLRVFTGNLDRIRGERLTAWKKVDKRQFWVVQYDNLGAVGRRRAGKSCHLWTAALEQALRWGGAANSWVVDEAECGCVTGTYDCVFTIQYVDL
jgi:serine/threonine-protein kinase